MWRAKVASRFTANVAHPRIHDFLTFPRTLGSNLVARLTSSPLGQVAAKLCEKTAQRPVAAAVLITGTKTCIADLIVQKSWEKRSEIDWKRNAVFTVFGLGYLGAFQCFLYSKCFPRWFGTKLTPSSTAACVVFDQTINTGVWYYPLFYLVQDAIVNSKIDQDTVRDAKDRYLRNIAADMTNCWKLWVPAQTVNFSVVPLHWRAPYAAGISFVWTMVLSSLRGDILADAS